MTQSLENFNGLGFSKGTRIHNAQIFFGDTAFYIRGWGDCLASVVKIISHSDGPELATYQYNVPEEIH